jgi:integrase
MAVRRHKSHGKWVWQARVAFRGRRTSVYCASYAEARTAERQLLEGFEADATRAALAGAAPAPLRLLFERYVANLEARRKSADTIGRAVTTAKAVETLLPALLDEPVSRIGDRELYAFTQARAATAKPSTINRDLRTLRAMFKQARPEYRFPGGVFFPSDDTRVRWLRPEEELLVFALLPAPFREIAKLAALTLMRQGEIRLLRREMVHLEQGVVLLPRAKAGARPVILSAEARKLLQGQLEAHPASDWIFPSPDGTPYSRVHVSRVFRKAARSAGLKDFHFHDLRHHGATMALNAGFTAPIVMALGGWKSEAMMRRYAAVTDPTLRAAAEAVSGTEGWHPRPNSAPALVAVAPSQG